MTVTLPPPPTRDQFYTNGVMTPSWFLWFTQLFIRIGLAVNEPLNNAEVLAAYDESVSPFNLLNSS